MMKSKNIKLDLHELHIYSLFDRKADLNNTVWSYVDWLKENQFPQSTIDVLLHLGSRSLRVLGLSFPKQETVAQALGLSRQTVNKAIGTLQKLTIIDSVRILAKKWRASGKVYRILPFDLDRLHDNFTKEFSDKVNDGKDFTLISDFEPYSTSTEKHLLNTYTQGKSSEDNTNVIANESSTVPKSNTNSLYSRLKELYTSCLNGLTFDFSHFKQFIGIIYSKLKKLRQQSNILISDAMLENIMYSSFNSALTANESYVKKNRFALLSGIIDRKINDLTMPKVAAGTRTEQLPSWMDEYKAESKGEAVPRVDVVEVDFEAERLKVLAKLEC